MAKPSDKTIWSKPTPSPLDSLVEIRDDDEENNSDGVRLYVAEHSRDFDGTPLYTLHYEKGKRPVDHEDRNRLFANMRFITGMPESILAVIK